VTVFLSGEPLSVKQKTETSSTISEFFTAHSLPAGQL